MRVVLDVLERRPETGNVTGKRLPRGRQREDRRKSPVIDHKQKAFVRADEVFEQYIAGLEHPLTHLRHARHRWFFQPHVIRITPGERPVEYGQLLFGIAQLGTQAMDGVRVLRPDSQQLAQPFDIRHPPAFLGDQDRINARRQQGARPRYQIEQHAHPRRFRHPKGLLAVGAGTLLAIAAREQGDQGLVGLQALGKIGNLVLVRGQPGAGFFQYLDRAIVGPPRRREIAAAFVHAPEGDMRAHDFISQLHRFERPKRAFQARTCGIYFTARQVDLHRQSLQGVSERLTIAKAFPDRYGCAPLRLGLRVASGGGMCLGQGVHGQTYPFPIAHVLAGTQGQVNGAHGLGQVVLASVGKQACDVKMNPGKRARDIPLTPQIRLVVKLGPGQHLKCQLFLLHRLLQCSESLIRVVPVFTQGKIVERQPQMIARPGLGTCPLRSVREGLGRL